MQGDPYVLEEEADSSRKDAIDLYGTHTYTLWRVHGWRMSFYSLARARGTHVRERAITRRFTQTDLGATLATKGRMPPQWLMFFYRFEPAIPLWRCPPLALLCCFRPVVHALGGSLGAFTPCVKRPFASTLKLSFVSAAAGFPGQGLLLCGALAHRSIYL
jgi:hypothetical protein